MPPKNTGKDKAAIEEEEEILQAVILADSFNSRFGPLTVDLPRCLLPVCNTPLLDWTFEALASAGVQQVFVFCCSHAELIRKAIDVSPWSRPSSGMRIVPIKSRQARSVGDALREIDTKQIISGDFVLVSGDIISNIRIDEVVKAHKERRKLSKDPIMTMVVREVGPRDRPRQGGDATVVVLDAQTSECLHYEYVSTGKSTFELPAEVISGHTDLDVRIDLMDCGIDICTPDVPALFSENFDYQELRKDFVRGVLTSDLLTKTIFCHVATQGYAARVRDTRMYGSISKDIVARRTFPLVPDDNHLGGDKYDFRRGHVYISKKGVSISRTSRIGNHTIVGARSEVQNDVEVASSVIGKNCVIGNRSIIRGSYIWDKTVIGSDCVIEESIIGAGVQILAGSRISRGCLVGQGVVLGPNARLDKFQRVSRHAPADEDDDWDGDADAGADDNEGDADEDEDDADAGSSQDKASERASVDDDDAESIAAELIPVLGASAKAYLWRAEDEQDSEGEEDVESRINIKLGRLGDRGSDLEVEESDLSDIESTESSIIGSPHSGTSATSATLPDSIPVISLDSSSDFASECRQSLERAFEENHTIDNAAIELKTLRMASNVPLKRVAESIVGFIVGKVDIVEPAAAQRAKVAAVVGRWGPLLTSIGWDDAPETIFLLQRYCAAHSQYQKIFGQILAAFYNDDVVDYDDIKAWYAKVLAMKKQGLSEEDVLAATLEDSMQQALRLIQHIHSLEEDDEEEEDSEEEEGEDTDTETSKARVAKPTASPAKTPAPKEESDEDEDEDEDEEDEDS